MTTVSFPELVELEGKLAARRKSAADFVTEAKADGTLDLSKVKSVPGTNTEKAAWFQEIQAEMADLAKQAEPLRALKLQAERGFAGDLEESTESGDDRPTGRKSTKSLGQRFIESDFHKKGFKAGQVEFEDVDVKTIFTTAAGWAPETTRGPRLVDYATRPIELLDLIPTTTTNESAVTYMEETTFTNAAAEVAEGETKPEAALALTEQTSPVRKIAVLLPVTDETLEDTARVQQYIDNRLPFMVRQRLALQIAVGNGTAPNLSGILDQPNIQTQAKGADPTPDAIYKAMVKVMTIGQAMPDAFVTNPLDWQDVRLLRTLDGIYIWGNPSEAGPQRIWGLNVVLVQAMTENTGVVGDFGNFSELAIKKGLTIDVGYATDDWIKNRKTFRAEMRAALIWYRQTAYCSVTGI